MMERSVYVLDLGSTKVVCLAARIAADGSLDVRGIDAVSTSGVYRGVVVDIDEVTSAIQAAVRRVSQMTGDEDISGLVVSIGGSHLDAMTGQGLVPIFPKTRPIGRDDVLQVINHARHVSIPVGTELIQAIPREFRIDGTRGVHRPIGMNGERLEVDTHIVTGLAENIRQTEDAVQSADYKVAAMVAGPVASAMGVLTTPDIEKGCAVIDLGGGTTSIAVFHRGGLVHTSCLPIGSQLVTSDLQQLLKVSMDEAERLKVESGSAWSAAVTDDEVVDVLQTGQSEPRSMQRKVLSEIIEARMREIGRYALKQIESAGPVSDLGAGIFLTGGGSQIEHIERLFESVIVGPSVRRAVPSTQGAFAEATCRPAMAAAVGLAKYALQEDEDEIAPASGIGSWKEAIRTVKSLFSGRE